MNQEHEQAPEAFLERLYAVSEVAAKLRLSTKTVQRMFRDEEGVIVISERPDEGREKKEHRTLRIPQSVLNRALWRRTNRR